MAAPSFLIQGLGNDFLQFWVGLIHEPRKTGMHQTNASENNIGRHQNTDDGIQKRPAKYSGEEESSENGAAGPTIG